MGYELNSAERTTVVVPGANYLDFSRDGGSMLVSGLNSVQKMRVDGSDRIRMVDNDGLNWAIHGPSGEILYSTYGPFVVRLPEVGRRDTVYQAGSGSLFPLSVAPDGRVVLLSIRDPHFESTLWDLETGSLERLEEPVLEVLSSGHGLYGSPQNATTVFPLDRSYHPIGEPRPLPYLDMSQPWSYSKDGTLFYLVVDGQNAPAELRHRLPDGSERILIDEIAGSDFDLSPDEGRIVALRRDRQESEQLMVFDLESGLETRIANGQTIAYPRWDPSGVMIYGFGTAELVRTPADQSDTPVKLLDVIGFSGPIDWMPDGERFLMTRWDTESNLGIGILEYDVRTDSARWVLDAEGLHFGATVSPDGHFVSYFSGRIPSEPRLR